MDSDEPVLAMHIGLHDVGSKVRRGFAENNAVGPLVGERRLVHATGGQRVVHTGDVAPTAATPFSAGMDRK